MCHVPIVPTVSTRFVSERAPGVASRTRFGHDAAAFALST
nr:hypothetical protein [Kibdelosporangium sp. MJ126-NF4]